MKKVLIIVKDGPFNSIMSYEAFRTAIGISANNKDVGILLLEDGVFNSLRLRSEMIKRPDRDQALDMLSLMKVRLYADERSCIARGAMPSIEGIDVLDKDKVFEIIKSADCIINF